MAPPAVDDDDVYVHRSAHMGTVVSITVVGHKQQIPRFARNDSDARNDRELAVERAIGWFEHVERVCTRFDPGSELSRLTARAGTPTPVSAVLFQALTFAMALADETRGAFDPTVGALMEARGFNVDYRSGKTVSSFAGEPARVWYRDLRLDQERQTATALHSLTLDLGAVAKGLAVDLAARELREYPNICVEAGGDGFVRGNGPAGDGAWTVGIRHPRVTDQVFESIRVTGAAVCTSGDYTRGRHIVDPRTGESPEGLASVTVVAPTTMLADGLGTAAFVLGVRDGMALLERHGAEGLFISTSLERFATRGFGHVATS